MKLTCRLKAFRLRAGMSQVQLAAETGFAQPQISRWESGVDLPQMETLMKLGKAMRVPWHMLISAHHDALNPADIPGAVQDNDGRWMNTRAMSEDELYITREHAMEILMREQPGEEG